MLNTKKHTHIEDMFLCSMCFHLLMVKKKNPLRSIYKRTLNKTLLLFSAHRTLMVPVGCWISVTEMHGFQERGFIFLLFDDMNQ